MKSQKGQIYQTSYYPYIFNFSLFYFTVLGFIAFLLFIWFDDFKIISKGHWPSSSLYFLWSTLMPNVYFFLVLIGFLSLWIVNFLFGRRYRLTEEGFYYRWLLGRECFISWDEIKFIHIENDFGFWRVILRRNPSESLFLPKKSFFFRVNVPMSCEFKREMKKYVPIDLQPEFPSKSLESIISERITEIVWNFINKFSKVKEKNNENSDVFYYNMDLFYNFKSGLRLCGFSLIGVLLFVSIWTALTYSPGKTDHGVFCIFIDAFMGGFIFFVSTIPGMLILAFLIGFTALFFLTSNYTLTNDGFFCRNILWGKENFFSWKEIDSIIFFYEFGFLNIYIFLDKKKPFKQNHFCFMVKKNIGEEPELEIKKYIPLNVKLKYSTAISTWHNLKISMKECKSLFLDFLKNKNLEDL